MRLVAGCVANQHTETTMDGLVQMNQVRQSTNIDEREACAFMTQFLQEQRDAKAAEKPQVGKTATTATTTSSVLETHWEDLCKVAESLAHSPAERGPLRQLSDWHPSLPVVTPHTVKQEEQDDHNEQSNRRKPAATSPSKQSISPSKQSAPSAAAASTATSEITAKAPTTKKDGKEEKKRAKKDAKRAAKQEKKEAKKRKRKEEKASKKKEAKKE